MDDNRFDDLARTLVAPRSRREAFAAALAGTLGLLGATETEAGKKRGKGKGKKGRKGKKKKRTGVPPATCSDGVRNGGETDVDCGGPCRPCTAGQICQGARDCESGICLNQVCRAATCNDGFLNGGETDVDCGGPSCPACGAGRVCLDFGDCESRNCQGGTCQVATCSDGVINQGESDVDCGGPSCPPCQNGGFCALPSDCASGVCCTGTCRDCCVMTDCANGEGCLQSGDDRGTCKSCGNEVTGASNHCGAFTVDNRCGQYTDLDGTTALCACVQSRQGDSVCTPGGFCVACGNDQDCTNAGHTGFVCADAIGGCCGDNTTICLNPTCPSR